MTVSRGKALELVRLLDGRAAAVYVVDAQRRIVFANAACGQWVGLDPAELVGQECRYHSGESPSPAVAAAAALAPPPEALQGQLWTAPVAPPQAPADAPPRGVLFVPVAGEGEEGPLIVAVAAVAAADWSLPEPPRTRDATELADLHGRVQRARRQLRRWYHVDRLVGDHPAMRQVRAQVALATESTATVLVVGRPGTGRQHVARAIHYGRAVAPTGPLVPLVCPLLSAELLQSTVRSLARARGGAASAERPATLVLQEADQLPAEAQAELSGLLAAGELPFRVVATAERTLADAAAEGRFRHDLALALSTLVIRLPSLRERLVDLPLLAQWFLEEANSRGARQLAGFTAEALDSLALYPWPGELLELNEFVAEAHARAEGTEVTVRDLPPRVFQAAEAARYPRPADEPIRLDEFLGEVERELIERALRRAKGNKTRAARLLGLSRPRLYRRMVQLGLIPVEELGEGWPLDDESGPAEA